MNFLNASLVGLAICVGNAAHALTFSYDAEITRVSQSSDATYTLCPPLCRCPD